VIGSRLGGLNRLSWPTVPTDWLVTRSGRNSGVWQFKFD